MVGAILRVMYGAAVGAAVGASDARAHTHTYTHEHAHTHTHAHSVFSPLSYTTHLACSAVSTHTHSMAAAAGLLDLSL